MKNKTYLTLKEVANELGVSSQTVRKYNNDGKIASYRTPGSHRVFKREDIDKFKKDIGILNENIVTAYYIRSSSGNKQSMENQLNVLIKKYGNPDFVYKDSGSGLNENRKGMWKLINDGKLRKFNRLIITNSDRLSRFGFEYLKFMLSEFGIEIIISEDIQDKSIYDELLQDFMSLVASFSGKFYKIRSLENQKRLLDKAREKLK